MTAPTWLDGYFSPYVAPKGTGFFHATDGKIDDEAKLVSDADVAAGAAIAGSKINPVFGGADGGTVAIKSDGTGVSVRASALAGGMSVGSDDVVSTDTSVSGHNTRIAGQSATGWRGYGGHLYLDAGNAHCEAEGTGGNVYLSAGQGFDGDGEIQVFGRVTGNPNYGDPLAFGVTIKETQGNTTLTLAGYEVNTLVIVLRGALIANTDVIFPAKAGYSKLVKNETTGSFTLTARTLAGGGGVVIPANAGRWVYCDNSGVLHLGA